MQRIEHRNHGFSLVEMLIVIALIAALAGLAIPAITRAGGFLSDDPDIAARELYASMRAARVYATTYRVNTAVVYGVTNPDETVDSVTDEKVRVIDSYGLARQLTRDERRSLGISATNVYALIEDREAYFRRLPANSCIASIDNDYELEIGINADGTFREGLVPVLLVDVDSSVAPATATAVAPINTTDFGSDAFPAHVFTPSGHMEPESSPVARFTVNVALMPDASLEERYTIAPGEEDPQTNTVLPEGQLKVPVRIELFRTTGRVKMTS